MLVKVTESSVLDRHKIYVPTSITRKLGGIDKGDVIEFYILVDNGEEHIVIKKKRRWPIRCLE